MDGMRVVAAALAWLVPMALAPVALGEQTPATGDGQVQSVYRSLGDRTDVWVEIVPLFDGEGPNPTTLRFSASYPGRRLRSTPETIELRAASDLSAYPLTLRSPTLEVVLDDATRLIVTDSPFSSSLSFPCPDCAFDAVVADLPLLTFARIVAADRVTGDAMGFPFRLDEDDRKALLAFARVPRCPSRRRPFRGRPFC
jgi:hypothetical protein